MHSLVLFTRFINVYLRKDCLSSPVYTDGNNHFRLDIPVYRTTVLKNVHSIVGDFIKPYFQTHFVKRNPGRPRESLTSLVRVTSNPILYTTLPLTAKFGAMNLNNSQYTYNT